MTSIETLTTFFAHFFALSANCFALSVVTRAFSASAIANLQTSSILMSLLLNSVGITAFCFIWMCNKLVTMKKSLMLTFKRFQELLYHGHRILGVQLSLTTDLMEIIKDSLDGITNVYPTLFVRLLSLPVLSKILDHHCFGHKSKQHRTELGGIFKKDEYHSLGL